jgi:hypothetical protein
LTQIQIDKIPAAGRSRFDMYDRFSAPAEQAAPVEPAAQSSPEPPKMSEAEGEAYMEAFFAEHEAAVAARAAEARIKPVMGARSRPGKQLPF